MTGNKKEQKKKPCNLSGAGLKEKLGKEKDLYTQGIYHFLQHDHITLKWYIRGLSVFAFYHFSFLHS